MKKKITLILVAVLLIISLVVGISYAYWRLTYTQTGVNKLLSSCFSMELTNEKNNITLDSAYPISDEKGKALTPYSFTITNTCDLFASYTINLEMLEGTTLNSQYIKTMINSEEIVNLSNLEINETSIEGATESRILFKGSLGSGDSTDYTLRIWMDSETPATDDTMNKMFQGKITVTAEVSTYSPVENGFINLAEALLVNEYQTTNVDVAKNKIASKQEVDTSKTAPIIEWQPFNDTSTQMKMITKVSSLAVGTYGISVNASKVLFGNSYSFDSETGYYELVDREYYSPESVDYISKDYYFCGSSVNTTSNNTISYWDGTKCNVMFKINKLLAIDDGNITLSSGDLIPSKSYTFEVYRMYEVELESDKSDKGLYQSEDDHGITYYYRGNVSNNNIVFGGYNWKVVRINGDGSIRLLYNGINSNNDGKTGIGTYSFNRERTNPTYVGYMYSNTLNTSYEDTISNDNDSFIKTKLDEWYKINILDKGYSSYIADSGFCNDRSIAIDSPSNGATSSSATYFSPRYRVLNHDAIFKCSNITNDLFTLSNNVIGNKKLTYPIGLITIDELIYAGSSYGYLNKLSYTYSNDNYMTMSPDSYVVSNTTAAVYIFADGAIGSNYVTQSRNIRPVINLKADTEITGGIGTKNDPFIVK